jgi:diguanylate cyclase (GGDEF)-like protein
MDKKWLIAGIAGLLAVAFATASLVSFEESKAALRSAIVESELPLTTGTICSEIQRDLVRPIFISSTMANDTFLRDWVLSGETRIGDITKYLAAIKDRFGADTAFFVSEKSRHYYIAGGILKTVSESEPRDAWYFRVRSMEPSYEINVDPDRASGDALTIVINHRAVDYQNRFIGATGIGLTVTKVRELLDYYEKRYQGAVYFVNRAGEVVVSTSDGLAPGRQIAEIPEMAGLARSALAAEGGSFSYNRNGETHLLNVRFIPDLNWFVFVEKVEGQAFAGIRRALYISLGIALAATLIVSAIVGAIIGRFHRRLGRASTTDKLTGLVNRQGIDLLLPHAMREVRRSGKPLSIIIFDIDHFKSVNDRFGHLLGDQVLRAIAGITIGSLRRSDVVCRWGGEEFLVLAKDCDSTNAVGLAEKVRSGVQAWSLPAVGEPLRVTVSLGVAQLADGDTDDTLLSRADAALLQAKREGRNRSLVG